MTKNENIETMVSMIEARDEGVSSILQLVIMMAAYEFPGIPSKNLQNITKASLQSLSASFGKLEKKRLAYLSYQTKNDLPEGNKEKTLRFYLTEKGRSVIQKTMKPKTIK